MTGNIRLELTAELSRRFSSIPVVLVTGYPSFDTAIQALGLSVFAYVLKPLDFIPFMKTVGEAVSRGRMIKTMRRTREALDVSVKSLAAQAEALTGQNSGSYRTELESYVAFTQYHLLSSVSDLYSLVKAAAGTADSNERLRLLDCPPLRDYRKLLEEAVQVLEKTRSAFKSKDLAVLRHKIESFLANTPV
jgi:response regulator RpfG family c-di-GMP phosphodiesterase